MAGCPQVSLRRTSHLNDTVLSGPVASAAGVSGPTRAYTTSDGHNVSVRVSRAYPDSVAADRALVDFLDSRLHGAELGSLSVYVGAPSEIERLCGGAGAVACYGVAEQRMYVPGEAVQGVPVEYALTHEYGHHVAELALEPALGRTRLGRQVLVERDARVRGRRGRPALPGQPGAATT